MRPKVRHVAVMTKNRDKMVEFYQKIFGLEPKRGFGGAIYMSDGDVNVALIEIKREDQQEGISHFGFEVDDLDDIKQRLKDAGFDAEIDSKSDKDSDHRIQDPDGHWVDMAVHRRWPKYPPWESFAARFSCRCGLPHHWRRLPTLRKVRTRRSFRRRVRKARSFGIPP